MHAVAVRRDFIAQHFLIGGDWGDENLPHSHHYEIEVRLEGETLDQHGYLVDIVDIETQLEEVLSRYRDRMLNDLAEFEEGNPSLERFAAIVERQLRDRLTTEHLSALTVTLWESPTAYASSRHSWDHGTPGH